MLHACRIELIASQCLPKCLCCWLLGAVLVTANAVTCTVAQTYPLKPVKIVVPFPPGAGGDFVTRTYTPKLAEVLGQQVIVDNRSGASGLIGAEMVAHAAPDGYTLLTASVSLAIQQSLSKNFRFDLVRDFQSVALLASTLYMIAVHPSLPINNIRELIALAKAKPRELAYGSSGLGSGTHLATQMFQSQSSVELFHVPYKGTALALADLMGGQISLMFASQVMNFVKTGKLRVLAIASAQRSQGAPDLPTVAESGLPGFEGGTWFALVAPTGLPSGIAARLNSAVSMIGDSAEIRDFLMTRSGAEPLKGNTAEVNSFIKTEIGKWARVVAGAGIRID